MTDLLAAIRERLEIVDSGDFTTYDGRFVYDCEFPQAALFAVLELHRPEPGTLGAVAAVCAHCREGGSGYEAEPVLYPCDTVKAIAKGLGIEA
jgi:hypothetical protein